MPGLYGMVSPHLEGELEAYQRSMADGMRHHPWYVEHNHIDPEAGLAIGHLDLGILRQDVRPGSNEEGTVLTFLVGEILNAQELRRELQAAGHRFQGSSDGEVLAHGYEQRGTAFFRDVRGSFACALWDARNRVLILANDRFGLRPLYYAKLGDGLVFASEVKAIFAHPEIAKTINPRGVAQFFTFGHLLNDDTLYRDVALLPAGSCLTYDLTNSRLMLDRPEPYEVTTSRGIAESEFLDCFDDAFGRAMSRATQGGHRLGLSLSGGMDSRTILSGIDTKQHPVTTVSLGMPGSIDTRSAAAMARAAGTSHHNYQLDAKFLDNFEQHLERMVLLTDGHYLCQCIVMPTLPLYRELGIEVLLRGHAGELLHMDKAYNFSLDREGWEIRDQRALQSWLYRHLRAYMVEAVDGPLFVSALEQDREALARESLDEALAASAGVEPSLQRIWHVFLNQRLRRETALSMAEFHSVVETRLPFLDADLIDLVFQMPPELKRGEKIQAHILRRRNPELLAISNANTGTRVGAGATARAASRFRMRVLAKLGMPGYQPYERLGLWLRRELRPLVERILLGEQCASRGVFNPDTLRRVVKEHGSGERNHTYLLLALMIFEKGQQLLSDPGARLPGSHDDFHPLSIARN